MLRNYQEGYHTRPNAHASLANTGRLHPGARRPQAGAIQYAHRPELTARPGPQPSTARQAVAVNQRNAKTQRAVHQLVRHAEDAVRLPTLPYSAYQPGAPGSNPWKETQDDFGQTWAATEVQHIWVYSHQINDKGDQEFMVANPRTGTRVYFRPIGYYSGQLNSIASATGEFGRVYANTLGTIVVVASGGVALEAGGGALISEYAAPYLTKEVVTGFGVRAGRDAGIQLFSSFATTKGSFMHRGGVALADLNYSSILVSGILNTEGLELKWPAQLLMASGTAAAGNLVTMKFSNISNHGSFVYGVNLLNRKERKEFLIGVGVSGLMDVSTEYATHFLAPHAAKLARGIIANTSGRAVLTTLRAVQTTRFTLPVSFGIGTTVETGKKAIEHRIDAHNEAEEKAKKRSEALTHKGPTKSHRHSK